MVLRNEIVVSIVSKILGERNAVRLSRALLNRAFGENNGDMDTNGEFNLLDRLIMNYVDEEQFVVFDVGANIGNWSLRLIDVARRAHISEKLNLFCFEPSKRTFLQLSKNLEEVGSHGISMNNIAFGDSVGSLKLYTNMTASGVSSLYNRRTDGLSFQYDGTESVLVDTIDSFCAANNIKHIDFLKIDVEGHELSVIKGACENLKNHTIDYIQFEYGGTWTDARAFLFDMFDELLQFGYKIGKIFPDRIEFCEQYDRSMETFQMKNYLACRPESLGLFK